MASEWVSLRRAVAFGICLLSAACGPGGDFLSQSDIVVSRRLYSDDKSRVVITYDRDTGATDGGATRDAILSTDRLEDDLTRTLLPESYQPVRWEPDNSLTVEIDYMGCLVKHDKCEPRQERLFGTTINVTLDDGIDGNERTILALQTDPGGKVDLIAYQYAGGRVQVSLVPVGEPPPAYGNWYIGYGLYGTRWRDPGTVEFLVGAESSRTMGGFFSNQWSINAAFVDHETPRLHSWFQKP